MAYSAIFQGCLRTAVSVRPSSLQFRRELVKVSALRPAVRRAGAAGLRAAPCLKRRAVVPMCFAGSALETEWRQRSSGTLQLLSRQRSEYYGRFAYQDVSSDESDLELGSAQSQLGQSTLDNVEDWTLKFNMLLRSKEEQELVSREKKDRRDFEQLAALAARCNLHSRQYSKVVVFSKVPLPNYRSDLDDKRPQREVLLPVRLQREVESQVRLHLTERLITGGSLLNKFAGLSPGGDNNAENVLNDQPRPPIRNSIILEKIHRRKSLQLCEKQQEWQASPDGQKMLEFRRSLPAYKERDALLKAIAENQVVVVSGETGCGKTTQLPQYILESEIEAARGATCSIICTQPRRISAISVSERVAAERGENPGESVGYKIRMEGIKGRDTRLLFCTTGILLRRLLVDRDLNGVTHVIVDEIHERGMNEDFLLIVLKDLLPCRPDLRLILMSATMNAELFSNYFYGAPMFHIPGFTYPVRAHFLEDVLEMTGYRLTAYNQIDDYGQDKMWKMQKQAAMKKRKSQIASSVEDAFEMADLGGYSSRVRESLSCWNPDSIGFNLIERVLLHIVTRERPGAVLVFMTGWDDINSVKEQLQADPVLGDPSRVLLLACHGSMPSSEQKLIFDRPEDGVRKIVLATNMAETSITINDVVFVVDCGKAKETSYDALNNTPCLLPSWISKAAARQRRGRAGRVQPGECYHLYPRCLYDSFIDYQMPELLRTPLQSLCLQIKSLQLGSITEFLSRALQPPELLSVQNAVENLKITGALDEYENLTVLGRHLSMLPVEPKLGKMLIYGAIFNCLDPIMTVVAGLSVRDPFLMPFDKKDLAESAKAQFAGNGYSDHLAVVRAYDGWREAETQIPRGGHEYCYRNFLSHHTLRAIDSLRKQFYTLLKDTGLVNFPDDNASSWAHDEHLVRAVLCAGLFPGVCSVVNKERSISLKTMEDGQVLLYSNSVNAAAPKIPYPWLVFNEKVKVNSVFLRDSTGMSDSALLLFGGDISRGALDGHLKMLGGYLEFFMNRSLSETYLTLRRELGELVQAKLLDPKFDIQSCSNLLMAVRQLISEDQCEGRFIFGRTVPKRASKRETPNIPFAKVKNGVGGDNAKNELQTVLQRAGHDVPTYKTKPLKNNQFRSTVTFNGLDFTGHPCSSKKQAEKEAASQALLYLKGETHSPSAGYDHAAMLLVKERKKKQRSASGARLVRRH